MRNLRSLLSFLVTTLVTLATFHGLWLATDGRDPQARSCRRCGRWVRPSLFVALILLAARPASAQEAPPDPALLRAAAESARDQRVTEATGALGFGVVLAGAGVASWVTPSAPDDRETRDVVGGVLVGAGGLMLVGGTLALAFDCAPPKTLEQMAKDARTERIATAVTHFVFGGLELAGGVVLEATADDHGLKWLGRSLMATSAASAILGVGTLRVRSEAERLFDLSITPRVGLGSIGLSGTF